MMHLRRSSILLLGMIGLCLALIVLPVQLKSVKAGSNDAAAGILAPLYSAGNAKPLPGRYIVRLRNELAAPDAMHADAHAPLLSVQSVQAAQEAHRAWLLEEIKKHPGSKLEHNYDLADFVGYSLEADDALRDKIRREPMVEFVEMDQPMWAFDQYLFDADSDAFVPVGQGAVQNAMEQLLSDLAKAAALEQERPAASGSSASLRQGVMVPEKPSSDEEIGNGHASRARKGQEINAGNKIKYQWNNMPAAAGHKKNHHHHHHHHDKLFDDEYGNVPQPPPVDSDPRKPKKEKHMLNCSTQSDAPWGLSRISSKKLPRTFGKFVYPSSAGKGVDVYIVDTGINVEHEDFEGRATWGVTIPAFDMDIDGNGHGTHCAGTVGSKTYGIAKKANLIAVKVLRTNGFGTNADVIKGIEWVVNQHQMKSRQQGNEKPRSVINMSLGGGKSIALEKVVDTAVFSGVHFAVAAGNDNADACNYSPAGAESAVTVGATTNKDKMAYFSNNGPCVNLFAPGQDIMSTWIGSGSATNTISGTSMASPHVAGVIALHLGEQDMEPSQMKKILIESALEDMLTGLPPNKSPNLLLNIHSLIKTVSNSAAKATQPKA